MEGRASLKASWWGVAGGLCGRAVVISVGSGLLQTGSIPSSQLGPGQLEEGALIPVPFPALLACPTLQASGMARNLCPFTRSAPGLPGRPGWWGGDVEAVLTWGPGLERSFPRLQCSSIHPLSRCSVICHMWFLKLFSPFSLWGYFRVNPSLSSLSPLSASARGVGYHRITVVP